MKIDRYLLSAAISAIIIFALDITIPLGVAFGVLYIIVILITLQSPFRHASTITAVITSLLILLGFAFSPEGGEAWKVLSNRAIAIFAIWIIALLGQINKQKKETLQGNNNSITLMKNIATTANESNDIKETIKTCLDMVCSYTGWPIAHYYAPANDGSRNLVPTDIWYLEQPERFETFRKVTEKTSFAPGIGLPGHILASGEPAWIADVTKDKNFPRAKLADDIGVRAGFAFPIKVGEEVVAGVLEFFTEKIAEPDLNELEIMAYIGTQLGRVIERKQTEDTLQESNERFRAAFADSAIGMTLVSLDHRIMEANPSFCQMLGYSNEEIVGLFLKKITHPNDVDASIAHHDQLITGEIDNYHFEKRYLHRQGHEIWVLLSVSLVRDKDTTPLYAIAQMQDITERKQAENKLQSSEEKYRNIFETSQIGMVLCGMDGTLVEVNQGYLDIIGYSKEEALNLTYWDITPRDYEEDEAEQLRSILETGRYGSYEKEYIHKDGNLIPVLLHGTAVKGEDGIDCIWSLVQDISERKQMEEALIESENKYRTLFEKSADAILIVEENKLIDSNLATLKMFGYQNKKELLEKHPSELSPDRQADGRNSFEKANEIMSVALEHGSHRFEWEHKRKNGEVFPVEVLLTAVPVGDRKFLHAVCRDITERNQVEALKTGQQKILELISKGNTSLDMIFEMIINFTESQLTNIHASIIYVKGKKLHIAAAPSMPTAYNELIDGMDIGPSAGSCGTAAYNKKRIIVADVANDPLWENLCHLGEEYGFCSCWSEPIIGNNGEVMATFNIYNKVSGVPDSYEIQLIETMAKLLRISIERKQGEEELQKLSRAVESSSSVVIITDLNGNIEYVNSKFIEVTGYTKEEVIGENPRLLKSGETSEKIYADMWGTIISGGEWKGEFHNLKKDGNYYWARTSTSGVKDAAGQITHFIGIQEDVTHEYELSEQLSYQACHDSLTMLINRREFERRTERLLSTIKQDKDEHALCYLDLDQFKVVNDTSGHAAGDELLRQLSLLLNKTVRHRDTLARLGGDEFGVLMEHCSLDDAHRVANSLLKIIQDYQFIWKGQSFRLGASIGLVAITEDIPNLTELLKQADAACYMAKDKGRNRVHVYHAEDSELAQRHGEMQWVTRIDKALEENRFCLYAQTILPLNGSTDKHYELLIRMVDEKGKLIPPGAFLPAAERYNLMTKLDYWVISNTLKLLAAAPTFLKQIHFVSINLSGQTLADKTIQDFVIEQFGSKNIPPGKICFEITETAAISNLSTANEFISKMKVLGCRFALDDFGSGLSSFAYLKNLPVDYLKIDGMFVKDIVENSIDRAMVKSINEIGQVMGMQTIAEFVENDEIKGMLREIGVNYAQGYGIGKPQSFDELLDRSNNVTIIKRPKYDESDL